MGLLLRCFGGWKRLRLMGGYSYEVSRFGGRRIVREAGYSHYGERDEHWLRTGTWAEEQMRGRFKQLIPSTRRAAG